MCNIISIPYLRFTSMFTKKVKKKHAKSAIHIIETENKCQRSFSQIK